jgi:hypothetical protein
VCSTISLHIHGQTAQPPTSRLQQPVCSSRAAAGITPGLVSFAAEYQHLRLRRGTRQETLTLIAGDSDLTLIAMLAETPHAASQEAPEHPQPPMTLHVAAEPVHWAPKVLQLPTLHHCAHVVKSWRTSHATS